MSPTADPAPVPAPDPSPALTLAELTTLRVGGPIRSLITAGTEAEIIEAVMAADAAGEQLLVLGGGSNVLAADGPFPGVVIRDARAEIALESEASCGGASVRVTAGTPWEQMVGQAVDSGWMGLEALTGIPGSTGATPVQNVGAYGQEVAQVISSVRTWDRELQRVRTFAHGELGFGYRTSALKRSLPAWGPTPRYVVLEVSFQMALATLSAPIRYAELARHLGVETGARVEAATVREAVLELRRGKGMVLRSADHDTWSAGSFFTNPLITPGRLPEGAPSYPADDGLVKTSAAWLIDHAGFGKGYGLPGPAALSTKHVLALTNRGGASADDLLGLARTVREGVERAYGITLVPEPVLVGLSL